MLDGTFDALVEKEAPVFEDRAGAADAPQEVQRMGDHNGPCPFHPLRQHGFAFLTEARITDGGNFVDQIGVEGDRHGKAEGKARAHTCGIGSDRLAHVASEVCKALNEIEECAAILPLKAGDETRVFLAGQIEVEAALKSDRPADPA